MLTSVALLFLGGLVLGKLFERMRLPPLVGMLLAGVVLGPHALNLLDASLLGISAELRRAALVVILARAGLALKPEDLKKVGRPAVLMCFVPALFEIAGVLLAAPLVLGMSLLEAAVLGSVIAAVSPAVVVPRMLRLMQEGYGTKKGIPQLVMAGASVDDVFVIVLFTSFSSLAAGGDVSALALLQVPVSIATGVLVGLVAGWCLAKLFAVFPMRGTARALVFLCVAFLLLALEEALAAVVPLSGLLAIMAAGMALLRAAPRQAEGLSNKYGKLWMGAEILLFGLVGATVDVRYAVAAGPRVLLVLALALLLRMAGVWVCVVKTVLNAKERLFCMLAYVPKATVQAAIGGVPLAMGLAGGNLVLAAAVISILGTAPLGALGIDLGAKRLLEHTPPGPEA